MEGLPAKKKVDDQGILVSSKEQSWNPTMGVPPPMTSEFGITETPTIAVEAVQENETNEESHEELLLPILDRELTQIGTASPGEKAQFVESRKNLPPDAIIPLYHGLNGGLVAALGVLESPDHGVRQNSGPTLALYPVGQFWKPGDAGFRYSIPRGSIEFPGESNSGAKFRVDEGGSVFLAGGLEALPLDQFNGEVLSVERKEDVYEKRVVNGLTEDVVVGERAVRLTEKEKEDEKRIAEKIKEFAQLREVKKRLEMNKEMSDAKQL